MDPTHSFPRLGSSAGVARAWVRTHLDELAGDVDVDAVLLVVSELVTNAYRHGRGSIEVALQIRSDRVKVLVKDEGVQFEPPPANGLLDGSGRGLRLVAALSADWGIEAADGGKAVWAEVGAARA